MLECLTDLPPLFFVPQIFFSSDLEGGEGAGRGGKAALTLLFFFFFFSDSEE